ILLTFLDHERYKFAYRLSLLTLTRGPQCIGAARRGDRVLLSRRYLSRLVLLLQCVLDCLVSLFVMWKYFRCLSVRLSRSQCMARLTWGETVRSGRRLARPTIYLEGKSYSQVRS